MTGRHVCPNCGTEGMSIFYQIKGVPVHSVLLLETREEALNFPTGDIALGFCKTCGFVSNVAFDPALQDYSSKRYEATQSYSGTFNAFSRRLAQRLIDRYDLHDKSVIEIGCGQGEFLIQLCEMGNNRGVGFDPAYRSEPIDSPAADQIEFVADYYTEDYIDRQADFVACKMTLEHIPDTAAFVRTVRRSVGDQYDTVVFFQIPNASYVFRDVAFWDVYYEHCSYFSPVSLAYLFQHAGFDVLDVSTDYDDQYLMIEAQPSRAAVGQSFAGPFSINGIRNDVYHFSQQVGRQIEAWHNRLAALQDAGQTAVIWGGGSKGVAFLTTLGIRGEIEYVVDINPNKHGMYMATTGQKTVGPAFLQAYQPDFIIVMNPVYCKEIQAMLDELGVRSKLITV